MTRKEIDCMDGRVNVVPDIVARYREIGIDVPEEYWPDVAAGVPWSEIMDSVPVYGMMPERTDPLDRLAAWVRRTFRRRFGCLR